MTFAQVSNLSRSDLKYLPRLASFSLANAGTMLPFVFYATLCVDVYGHNHKIIKRKNGK
jgi:hypothetical protein